MSHKDEKRYQRAMRDRYKCCVGDSACCRLKLVHKVDPELDTYIGNSIVLCRQHATAGYCSALELMGRENFEVMYSLDLAKLAEWCQWEVEAGPPGAGARPPRGVNRV